MNIKKINRSANNDFWATFVCPICGYEFDARGYSDGFYYNTVMPNAICPECHVNSHNETEEQLTARMGRTFRI